MAGMNTFQMIETIPEFDGVNFVRWTRLFNDILQLSWPFLGKIVSGHERPEPVLRGSSKGKGNMIDFDVHDSNPSDVSGHDSDSMNDKPQNGDDIKV